MDIMDVLNARPSVSVEVAQRGSERAAYLDGDGTITETPATLSQPGNGDVAMTAGALALLALAGLVAMRVMFKGALP